MLRFGVTIRITVTVKDLGDLGLGEGLWLRVRA